MDRAGRSELHYCAVRGDVEGIRQRLTAGDDVAATDVAGYTPLHFAAQESQAEAAAVLLEMGAPVDAQDGHGNTQLFRAVLGSHGDGAVVRLLLEASADPDLVNNAGVSPRGLAQTIANYDVARFFDGET